MKSKEVARQLVNTQSVNAQNEILAEFATELIASIPRLVEERGVASVDAANSVIDEVCDRWRAMKHQTEKLNSRLGASIKEDAITALIKLKAPELYEMYKATRMVNNE